MRVLLLCFFLVSIYASSLDDVYTRFPETSKTNWIWANDTTSANQWVAFRNVINIDKLESNYTISIAVDSKYWLWINDKLVVFEGQLKRGPNHEDTFFDSIDVTPFIQINKNTISVLVWYFGKDGFSHVGSGSAGFLFALNDNILISDDSWKALPFVAYQNDIEQINWRLSEGNVVFNATADVPDWNKINFDDSNWNQAKILCQYPCKPFNTLWKRPMPQWKISDLILKTGDDITIHETIPKDTIIQNYGYQVNTDYIHYSIHLPVNVQYTPYLHIVSSANLIIFIDPDNKRIGNEMGHSAKYITKDGEQEYESLGWLNGEYINYIIPVDVKVISLGWRESGYNSEFVGTFECDDSFFNKLWMKCRNTLYVTIRDNYMDCPDRERTYWTGDQVNEAIMSYYTFDNSIYDAVRKGIITVEEWIDTNGVIPTIAPSSSWFELPVQSLSGIIGTYTYYFYSGDKAVLSHTYEHSKNYVLTSFSMKESGLPNYRPGSWDWIDWGDNIDGYLSQTIWYYYTLTIMEKIAVVIGKKNDVTLFQERSDAIRKQFDTYFWNQDKQVYVSPDYTGDIDDRGNALAVVAGLVNSEHYPAIIKVLQEHKHSSPYMEKYVLEALYLMEDAETALSRMKERYQEMVDYDYSTLWELWDINGGTKNHAWSGGPLSLLTMYTVGVRPTKVAYQGYEIKPLFGHLKDLHAIVPTIKGNMNITIHNPIDHSSYAITINSLQNSVGSIYISKKHTQYTRLMINNVSLNLNSLSKQSLSSFEHKTNTTLINNNDDIIVNVYGGYYSIIAM
ncbi:hypothetical protein WA158_005704 [Blastocystis sp. Blastoise]